MTDRAGNASKARSRWPTGAALLLKACICPDPVRSGPGGRGRSEFGRSEIHIISASPSKQPLMVGSTLGVYSVGLIFVSARTKKDIIIIGGSKEKLHFINVWRGRSRSKFVAEENNL